MWKKIGQKCGINFTATQLEKLNSFICFNKIEPRLETIKKLIKYENNRKEIEQKDYNQNK